MNVSGDAMAQDTNIMSSGVKPRCTFGRLSRQSVLFTGPDGIRDYKAKVENEHRYIGEGTMSPEGTSEADYLWRAPLSTPHPKPKSVSVGEIGWGIPELHPWFASSTTGAQLMLGEFKQAAEDRHTHLLQNPCDKAWKKGKDHKKGKQPK